MLVARARAIQWPSCEWLSIREGAFTEESSDDAIPSGDPDATMARGAITKEEGPHEKQFIECQWHSKQKFKNFGSLKSHMNAVYKPFVGDSLLAERSSRSGRIVILEQDCWRGFWSQAQFSSRISCFHRHRPSKSSQCKSLLCSFKTANSSYGRKLVFLLFILKHRPPSGSLEFLPWDPPGPSLRFSIEILHWDLDTHSPLRLMIAINFRRFSIHSLSITRQFGPLFTFVRSGSFNREHLRGLSMEDINSINMSDQRPVRWCPSIRLS